jgi:hypothetical protein
LRSQDSTERLELLAKFHKYIQFFETELGKRGSKYLSGQDHPGMLDYMAWPWLERHDCIPMMYPDVGQVLPESKFPKLVSLLLKIYNHNR